MDNKDNNNNLPNQLNIDLTPEIAEGTYSNLTIISHSPSEFILDFINVMPNTGHSKVKSRIIVTPQNAKRVLMALKDNIAKFENQFGKINDNQQIDIPLNFGTPTAQA